MSLDGVNEPQLLYSFISSKTHGLLQFSAVMGNTNDHGSSDVSSTHGFHFTKYPWYIKGLMEYRYLDIYKYI